MRAAWAAPPRSSPSPWPPRRPRAPARGGSSISRSYWSRRRAARSRSPRPSAQQAHAKAREVLWRWGPQLEVTRSAGPAAHHLLPSASECTSTEPDQTRLGFDGIFGRVDGRLTMPLFTFGKLTDGKRAADAGAAASERVGRGRLARRGPGRGARLLRGSSWGASCR